MSAPPPPPPTTIFDGGSSVITQMPQLPPPYTDASSRSSSSDDFSTSSIVIVVIIIASAVIISASIYLLLRLLSKRIHHTFSAADDVVLRRDSSHHHHQQCHAPAAENSLLDSLPLFTFRSVTGNLTGGDCAVCLSKFEPHDQLRLLPICCHAFHAACIDAWIVSNQTCPLCRSAVVASDAEVLNKILPNPNRGIGNGSFRDGNGNGNGNSGSFRIEIGSISRRRGGGGFPEAAAAEGERRSYSIGSFEYIVDDNGYEVSAGSVTHRRGASDCTSLDKESSIGIPVPEPPGEALAADVSSGRNWLRDYVDRLASVSFRSSGRFFSGSSRRSDPLAAASAAAVDDLEANRVGEEISELFRWLSGI